MRRSIPMPLWRWRSFSPPAARAARTRHRGAAATARRDFPAVRGHHGHQRGQRLDVRARRGHRFVHLRRTAASTTARWPETTTIRPEEFVNSFNYRYPQPRGDGFAVTSTAPSCPALTRPAPAMRLLRVGLQTRAEDEGERRDADAHVRRSTCPGSMAEPGRLDLVQDALHYLVDQLRPQRLRGDRGLQRARRRCYAR